MSPTLLALCAATSWSLSHVFVRLGSRSVAPLAGVVLSLASSSLVLLVALTIRGDVDPNLLAVGLFALAGMTGPGLGRILSITAISRLGATRASPVKSAAQPIIAVTLGVVVLAETVELTRLMGIALTLSGVILVVVSGQRAQSGTTRLRADGTPGGPGPTSLGVLLWPIGAGAAYALTDLTRKNAMQVLDDAFLGGAIGVLVALTIWGTVLLARGGGPALWRDIRSQNSIWFMISGTASGAAQVFVLSALRDGDLSLVAPILALQPILIAVLARAFINRLEKVGLAVGGAALLATAGTILLSL